jgi:Tfp pilus assembly protein PilO
MDLQSLPWYGQFLVFLIIGAVIFGFFYFMMYSGTQDQINGLSAEVEQLDTEIKTAEKKEGKLKQLKDEIGKQESVLEKLKEILPEKNEISGIIKRIESIISASRLRVQRWSPPVQRKKEIYIQHDYAIDVEGTFHGIGVFFDQLSRIKKIFIITALEIRPNKKLDQAFIISASFKASTFTYLEAKEPVDKKASRRRGG